MFVVICVKYFMRDVWVYLWHISVPKIHSPSSNFQYLSLCNTELKKSFARAPCCYFNL